MAQPVPGLAVPGSKFQVPGWGLHCETIRNVERTEQRTWNCEPQFVSSFFNVLRP